MAGYDTASFVGQAWSNANGKNFGKPSFWLRYFTPCQTTPLNTSSSNANSECDSVWDSNSSSPCLGPITVPAQSRLNGSQAEGHADAQSFCSSLTTTYNEVIPLQLPNNGQLYLWLDQEPSTSLSVSYWNGWALYVDGFNFGGYGTYPLYPCLYCNPGAPPPNCSTIGNISAAYCTAVWSSEPQRCTGGYDVANPPPWAPTASTCPRSRDRRRVAAPARDRG